MVRQSFWPPGCSPHSFSSHSTAGLKNQKAQPAHHVSLLLQDSLDLSLTLQIPGICSDAYLSHRLPASLHPKVIKYGSTQRNTTGISMYLLPYFKG